jgi:hypothetical protein
MSENVLKLPVYDLYQQDYLPTEVVYYNTLLQYLYADAKFAIGDVSGFIEKEDSPGAIASLEKGWETFKLSGATNSRRLGRAIFAQSEEDSTPDHFLRLLGSNRAAANYGSNLTTECQLITTLTLRIRIVEDGKFRTGDCHAKASALLFKTLGLQAYVPFQFRAVDPDKCWLTKGTIAYLPSLDSDPNGVSLVIPRSCFKGNNPGRNGIRAPKALVFGVVQLAPRNPGKRWGSANSSYSCIQFLPWDAVKRDIVPDTLKAVRELNELSSDRTHLLEFLTAKVSGTSTPELLQILHHDTHSILTTHPRVVKHTLELMREYLVGLATGGSLKFNTSMTMPDEQLEDGEVCIPGIPDGTEIVGFRYPMRWRYDWKVWVNRALDRWQNFDGMIAASEKTWREIGGDCDGDLVCWKQAQRLPNVAAAIKTFAQAPQLTKDKEILDGSLAEITVRAMSNNVGLISYLIAKANAIGRSEIVEELAQQLQIEVDSLKHAAKADPTVISNAQKAMGYNRVPWLSHYRNRDVYVKTPLPVNEGATDTISQLVGEVNQLFIPPQFRMANLRTFINLFPDKVPNSWLVAAQRRVEEFAQDVQRAVAPATPYKERNQRVPRTVQDKIDENLKGVTDKYRSLLDNCKTQQQRRQVIAALWQVQHRNNTTKRSTALVFLVGLPFILDVLDNPPIHTFKLIGLKGSDYPDTLFKGETLQVKVDSDSRFGNYLVARDTSGKVLGTFTEIDGIPVNLGQEFRLKLYTRFSKANKPTRIDAFVVGKSAA